MGVCDGDYAKMPTSWEMATRMTYSTQPALAFVAYSMYSNLEDGRDIRHPGHRL